MPADPCYNHPTFLRSTAAPTDAHRWRCPLCGYVGALEQAGSTLRAPAHYAPGDEPGEMEVN